MCKISKITVRYRALLMALYVSFISHTAWANSPQAPERKLVSISKERQWERLLGFKKNTSQITGPGFFLAQDGQTNALAELRATLQAFRSPATHNPNNHPICKFPARYLYLDSMLDLESLGVSIMSCPDFEAFIHNGKISSISVIFATGFLENPASYYGHLLVKLNHEGTEKNNTLRDSTINYGAAYPPNENMLVYIVKGITGGYLSRYTQQDFYYHLHNYNDDELRDLWEYELNLSDKQTTLLAAHFWEMLNAQHIYYFFNRNCAYRIGESLELVLHEPLVNPNRPWETPQAIMQRLSEMHIDQTPVVNNIRYIPSRQSKLYSRYAELSRHEKSAVRSAVENPGKGINISDSSGAINHIHVLDTLIDYYKFRGADKGDADEPLKNAYRQSLIQRTQLPASGEWASFESGNRPHLGHAPSYISASAIHHEHFDRGVSLTLRPAYYDALDSEYGLTHNSALSMLELKLTHLESKIFVDQLKLVEIQNVGRNFTNLPGDNKNSWRLFLGAEQESLSCIDCLGFSLNAHYGRHLSSDSRNLGLTAFAGAGYLGNDMVADELFVEALALLHFNTESSTRLELKGIERQFINSSDRQSIFQLQTRTALGKNHDVRFSLEKHDDYQASVSIGMYW